MRWLVFLLAAGCHTGTEVAAVSSVELEYGHDDIVILTATLDCKLVAGRGRADGKCDADNSHVCVEARWYATDPPRDLPPPALTTRRKCGKIDRVRGATVRLELEDLPGAAQVVVVGTMDQARVRDELRHGVVARR